MLERIKPCKELVNEMLDGFPESVWTSATTTFFDPAIGGGQFVKEIEQRLREHGHSDKNIASRVFGFEYSQALVDLSVNMNKLVGQYRKMPYEQYFLLGDEMKFDVYIGNPPYQDKKGNEKSTNSADLYARFVHKAFELSRQHVAMIIPSGWSGAKNSNLKRLIFETHQPSVFNTHGKKWFDVEMNTCYFITQVGRQGPTEITDALGNSLTMTLNHHVAIPTDLSTYAVREKIVAFAKKSNLHDSWLRGKLNLNNVKPVKQGVEFVCAVGKKNDALVTEIIDQAVESTGYGLHKLVIPNMGSSNEIGNIKIAKKNQVGGHSVVFITADTADELPNLKGYLESRVIKFLIASVKISTPNSKQLFKFIPRVDFTRPWTDQDLYKHFGLTDKEIEYVENQFN